MRITLLLLCLATLVPFASADEAAQVDAITISADGRRATRRTVLAGVAWNTRTYEARSWMRRDRLGLLLVDSGGPNERFVELCYGADEWTPDFSTTKVSGDTVEITVPLTGKIVAGESVEVAADYQDSADDKDGFIHTDGRNTSLPIPSGTSVANASTAKVGGPAIRITTQESPGLMDPAVVSAHVRIEDFDAGDLTEFQDAEFTWWLSGDVDSIPAAWKMIRDPRPVGHGTFDYTAEGNFRGIGGCAWLLPEGTYEIHCRLRNSSGDSATANAAVVVAANTRTRHTINSEGGADFTSLEAAVATHGASDEQEFVVEGGHTETYADDGTLISGDRNVVRWDGKGERPRITGTRLGLKALIRFHRNAEHLVVSGLHFIPDFDPGKGRGGDYPVFSSGRFLAVTDVSWESEPFTHKVGGKRFNDVLNTGGDGPVLILNNARASPQTATAGYGLVYAGKFRTIGYYAIGNTIGFSANESCSRPAGGSARYTSLFANSLVNDGFKSCFRISAGVEFTDYRMNYCKNGDGWMGSTGGGNAGGHVSAIMENYGDWATAGPNGRQAGFNFKRKSSSFTVANNFFDCTDNGNAPSWARATLAKARWQANHKWFHNSLISGTSNYQARWTAAKGDLSGSWGLVLRGSAYDKAAPKGSAQVMVAVDNTHKARAEYNVYDVENPARAFVRLVASKIKTFAQWQKLNMTTGEVEAVVAFDDRLALTVPQVIVPRTIPGDYYGDDRAETTNAGCVRAATEGRADGSTVVDEADPATVVARLVEAARARDVETLLAQFVPEHRAMLAWVVGILGIQMRADEADAAARAKLNADLAALESKHGVREPTEESAADTPNPRSIETTIRMTRGMFDGVDLVAFLKDALALTKAYDTAHPNAGGVREPFREFVDIEVARVETQGREAVVFVKQEDEVRPMMKLVETSDGWRLSLVPPNGR